MTTFLNAVWTEDEGVLSFEWVLMITLLTIGIVGGLAAARDAIIDELGDAAQAALALDQSYDVDFPLGVGVFCSQGPAPLNPYTSSASNSGFLDAVEQFDDGLRTDLVFGQGPVMDDF